MPDWALRVVVVVVCVGLPAVSVGVFFVVRLLDSWRTDASSAIVVAAGLLTVALHECPLSGSVSVPSDPFTHGTLANLLAGKH